MVRIPDRMCTTPATEFLRQEYSWTELPPALAVNY